MLFNRDSAIQKYFRRFCTACKSEDFRFPVSRPDDRAIPSRRSSVHCSIHPDDVPYRPDARQIKHHPSGRRVFPSGPFTVSRSFCASLHSSGRLSSPSKRRPVIDQLPIFFPKSFMGRLLQPSGRCEFPSGRAHT
jgi:hypothetical protein